MHVYCQHTAVYPKKTKKKPCTDSKLFSIDKLTDKLKYNKLKMMCVTMYMRWIITDKYECGSQLYNNCNTVNINSYETNNNILCINPNDTIYLQPNDILGIASWNIESLRSKLRSNKRDINSIIQCYDIIGF